MMIINGMDSIVSGLKVYKFALIRYIKNTYITHIAKTTTTFNNKHILKLHTEKLINPTEYFILNQILQIKLIINGLSCIANYGFYSQKTIIELIETSNELHQLFSSAHNIRELFPVNYRLFQIFNHYAVIHLNKVVYKLLHDKLDISKYTQTFLKDILSSDTKKDINTNESNRLNLTKEFITKLLEMTPSASNNFGKITRAFTENNTRWLSKSISTLTVDTISGFVINNWLPNKLTLEYRADTVIKLKAHITEAILLECKTGITINSRLYNSLIKLLFANEENRENRIKQEKAKLKKFTKAQRTLSFRSIKSRIIIIKHIQSMLNNHIVAANISVTTNNITHEVKKILDETFQIINNSKEPWSKKMNVQGQHTSKIKQDLLEVLLKSREIIKAKSDDEQISALAQVSLGSIRLSQDIATAYISDLADKITKNANNLSAIKQTRIQSSQHFFYKKLLDKQLSILAEELEVINYRGLALLTRNQEFSRSFDTNCGTDIYIKNFSPIGIQKRLPTSIAERQDIIKNISKVIKELKKSIKPIPRTTEFDFISKQYKNIKKTIKLLKNDKENLKKYVQLTPSLPQETNHRALNKLKKIIQSVLCYFKTNKIKFILNLSLYALKTLFFTYNILKYITNVISKAIITIFLPFICLYWVAKKLFFNTISSPTAELIEVGKSIESPHTIIITKEKNHNPELESSKFTLEQELLPKLNSFSIKNHQSEINKKLLKYLNKCHKFLNKKINESTTLITKIQQDIIFNPSYTHDIRHQKQLALDKIKIDFNKIKGKLAEEKLNLHTDISFYSFYLGDYLANLDRISEQLLFLSDPLLFRTKPPEEEQVSDSNRLVQNTWRFASEVLGKAVRGDAAALTLTAGTVAGVSTFVAVSAARAVFTGSRAAYIKSKQLLSDSYSYLKPGK